MKQVLSFVVPAVKPRNHVAQALLDRDGEFKPRTVKPRMAFKRKPKNAREALKDWE
jgi:hypothetical protein